MFRIIRDSEVEIDEAEDLVRTFESAPGAGAGHVIVSISMAECRTNSVVRHAGVRSERPYPSAARDARNF